MWAALRRFGHTGTIMCTAGLWLMTLTAAAEPPEGSPNRDRDDVAVLAETIDRQVAAQWQAEEVTPAPLADDAEFFRRIYLDLAGRIPSVSEVRSFLADESPDKRRRAVDRLLQSPGYITHFTNVWRRVMIPESDSDPQVRFLLPSFEAWLRAKLSANVPYDELVHKLLTAPLEGAQANRPGERPARPTPLAFYGAKQVQPENLAAATSRMFLGLRIGCAQCHHHPFDKWQQEQFWSLAAFFAGLEGRNNDQPLLAGVTERIDRRQIAIPDTERVVQAAYLDGTQPQWTSRRSPRETLADWLTSPENPYFARAAVNRLWGHFFGRGLVDPVDDFSELNPPSHPELLDELARQFAAHDFDLKFLIRAITASRTYQLTSRLTHESQQSPELFARMAVRGLTPEQLFASLAQATGYYEPFQARNPFVLDDGSPQSEIMETFANESDSPTEQSTTILQALAMMNGRFIGDATALQRSQTLTAVAEFPLMSTAERIETLYLATLSRPPQPEELDRLVDYVASGGSENDPQQALSDVFWALLNSSEFLLNH